MAWTIDYSVYMCKPASHTVYQYFRHPQMNRDTNNQITNILALTCKISRHS